MNGRRVNMSKLSIGAAARAATDKWGWMCPLVAIGLAAAVLAWFGFSWWAALLVALLLVCPALLVWGAIELRDPARRRQKHRDQKESAQ